MAATLSLKETMDKISITYEINDELWTAETRLEAITDLSLTLLKNQNLISNRVVWDAIERISMLASSTSYFLEKNKESILKGNI